MDGAESAATGDHTRAWSFLITGEERQFQGNAGYEDVAEESYSYDSTVGNYRRVAVGDLVVIRNSREALGVGYVEELEVLPHQQKLRSRCPGCTSTSFKERTTERPRYRCSPCRKTFDRPNVETIPVTTYRAHYGGTWQPLDGCLDKSHLAELNLSRSDQQSIKALDPRKTFAALQARGVRLPGQSGSSGPYRQRPLELPGGRQRTTTAARRGQDAFRRALVRHYGLICAVTGPAPAEVLEAAHLRPFATTEKHRTDEGLLLRADIHRLFDSGLLAFSPRLEVCVAPSLRAYSAYGSVHGRRLHLPEDPVLNPDVIREHHTAVTATW
ncbi:HNH endonuclease [Streptomyces sp. HNM0574]|uniref:HNH endonuclease n=1 Tax=Streptomyces sp. HNM0574 TaxID=2714954 RepID=UPI00146DAF10|nr:HNH endonuclease [Streptomyces sp. HNM0574]NLU66426.1 HNH endonuclease [Streptomyces sp. HNM0574]